MTAGPPVAVPPATASRHDGPPPVSGSRPLLLILVAALVLLNFPMLAVVEAIRADGHPYATAIYLFVVWGCLIAAAAVVLERRPPG